MSGGPAHTGGCLCGAVRFEIDEPLVKAAYCHCRRCQQRTGTAASINAPVPPGGLHFVQGEELVSCYEPPDGAAKCFCSRCGAALFARGPASMGVRFGALDEDPGIRPSHRQYVDFAAPWEPIPDDGLPRYPGPPPPA